MKGGGQSVRPISNVRRKCHLLEHSSAVNTLALIVLGSSLLLSGCGELSLSQLLANEEPGELSISPTNALVPAAGTLDLTGNGGYEPYTYENKGLIGSIDAVTGQYTAPPASEINGTGTTEVEVTDGFGAEASTTVTVFAPISLSPAMKTIGINEAVTFTVSGGVPDPDYGYFFSVDGADPVGDADGVWTHTFDTEGSHMVEAEDSLGNTTIATITATSGLAIDAEQSWVLVLTDPPDPQSSTNLRAVNQTSAHTFSILDPQTGLPEADGWIENPQLDTATYHAPESEKIVTIELEDVNLATATAEIHVLSAPPQPIAFPSAATVPVNGQLQLTAVGGVEPHTFRLVGDGSLSPHPNQDYRIRYQAPGFATTAYVWVQDALGTRAKATIYVVEG
jgi:hypothetical protein